MKSNPPVSDLPLNLCLIAMLGDQSTQRVLELVHKLGDDGEELVMLLITELITAKEETFNAQETIDYLQLRLYGQNRERFTDPEQTKLFDDYIPEVHAPESEEEEEFVKKRCRRPRGLYSGRNKDLPRVIIPIDPEGDLSHLQKIGEEVHSVLHF